MRPDTRTRGDLLGGALAAMASLQFGVIVVLGKRVLERGMTVESMLAMRFGTAAVFLAIALSLLRRPIRAAPGERTGLAVLALFGYAVESSFFFSAATRGTAAAVTLLFFTYPVFVTIGTWFLGRGAPAGATLLALLLAVVGAAIVVATGAGLSIEAAGVAFALASAATYSAYLVGTDVVLRRTGPLTSALWVSAGASLGLVASAGVTGRLTGPTGAADWWSILAMGVATAGAFVCLLGALQRMGAVRTSIVSATEPLSAALLGFLFLDETVTWGVAVGGAMILAGAVTASLARQVRPQEQQIT
ncbi:MAG TPA: DMT family transporter [Actinomycetota bacterium]|nr:DMT family transporter [Actinomycetota bacterium]